MIMVRKGLLLWVVLPFFLAATHPTLSISIAQAQPAPPAPPAPPARSPGAATAPKPAAMPTQPTAPPAGMDEVSRIAWEGSRLLDRGDIGAAQAQANAALGRDRQNVDANVLAARVAMLRGDLSSATSSVNVALAASETDTAALYVLIRLNTLQGRPAAPLTRIRNLANTWRDKLGVQLAYGEIQLLNKKYAGARAAATRVLKKAETSVAAMKLLARTYLAEARPRTAEYILQQALKIARDPEALLVLANIRVAAGKLSSGKQLLEEAVRLRPGYVEALTNLGAVYLAVGSDAAALQPLQRAVAVAPAMPEAWLNLGSAQRGARDFSGSEASWKKVLELDKTMGDAWFNLAVMYLENPVEGQDRVKRLTDAINAFNAFNRISKGNDVSAKKYIGEARLLLKQEQDRRKEELKSPDDSSDEQPTG